MLGDLLREADDYASLIVPTIFFVMVLGMAIYSDDYAALIVPTMTA